MIENSKKKNSEREHLLRWLTSLILAPVLIFVIGFADKVWLAVLVAVATGIGYWELNGIIYTGRQRRDSADLFLLLALIVPACTYWYGIRGLLGGVLVNLLACFSAAIHAYGTETGSLEKLVFRIFHVIYIPYCLAHMILLERVWIFFVLAVIFAGDSGAYYTGKKLGQRKLCPKVSPGKTMEGAVGGFIASVLVALLFGAIFSTDKSLLEIVLMGSILNIIGQLGDLGESFIKRSRGVKDSSHILPGHGGLLDRVDSLLFAFPALYYLL